LVFHCSLISVLIELAEQAHKKEQQQQQLQKNKKKKATKSNTNTQVKNENGTTNATGGIDSVSSIKKMAPKHQTATITQSRPARKGTYFELHSHSK
jgi:DNA-binding protein H-NS